MISDLIFLDSDGLHLPDYPTILADLQEQYRGIFGADAYLEPDSQDGQWLGALALAIYETGQLCAAIYASFAPSTARGDALSRLVRINGMKRLVPTHSQVDVVIVGQPGTVIIAGLAEDAAGNRWALPPTVTVPSGGEITVTATAVADGPITVAEASITRIVTPTRGWQSISNPSALLAGDAGSPGESDAALRRRQLVSTMIPSASIMDGIVGAVAQVDGVKRFRGYENATDTTDGNGIPSHSISIVADGGIADDIALAIHRRKTAGTGTYGTTTVNVEDQNGISTPIHFYRPTPVPITVEVHITTLDGFLDGTAATIAAGVADYVNAMGIGDELYLNRLYTPANLLGIPQGGTFAVDSILIARDGGGTGSSNIVLAFNEVAICDPATNVTVSW